MSICADSARADALRWMEVRVLNTDSTPLYIISSCLCSTFLAWQNSMGCEPQSTLAEPVNQLLSSELYANGVFQTLPLSLTSP